MSIAQLRKAAVVAVAILTAISLVTGQAAELIGKAVGFLTNSN